MTTTALPPRHRRLLHPRRPHLHRPHLHRPHGWALVGVLVVSSAFAGGSGWFAWRWTSSATHPVSVASALERFRAQAAGSASGAPYQPRAGVYPATGSATAHVSAPPKTLTEGPSIPVTVSYAAGGCWQLRVDYSDSHWEGATFCPRGGGLEETARGGWMRWDFVVLTIEDTSIYRCDVAETVIPAQVRAGQTGTFSCTGTNDQLHTGPVTMRGSSVVVGAEQMTVAGRLVPVVHVRDRFTFSGGQTGTDQADLWFGADGLPLRETWNNEVHTPSPLGTTTMTASGSFRLTSLEPRS